MLLRISFIVSFFWVSLAFSASINSIKFQGLKRTKEDFLLQLIDSKKGETFDSLTLENDVQILRNLNLFFSLDASFTYDSLSNFYDIVIVVREAKYVYPLVSLSGFDGVFKLQLGVNDINWEGRNKTLGFLYQYYDRHSINIYQKTPRHKNGKTGHELSMGKYSTIEPLYFGDVSSDFNFDNYSISIGGYYWLSPKCVLNLGGMLMHEKYLQLDELPPGATFQDYDFYVGNSFELSKYQIRTGLSFNMVNQHYEFFDGLRFDLYSETIQTHNEPEASFLKLLVGARYYKHFGENNVAVNYRFGVATNNESPFSPFVLDGFINLRGIGDRVSRGTAENIFNFEYRRSVVDSRYVCFQVVGFADVGSLRQPGASLSSMLDVDNMNYYTGLGVRLHSKVFYKTIFRLDYAIDLNDVSYGNFSFGLGQFI